jgi:hypothetical protein
MVDSAPVTPRKEGSAASGPSIGCAAISAWVARRTSSVLPKSRPSRAKNSPPSGRRTI